MPKYSVEDVLDIIKALSPEEKSQLQAQLPSVLEAVSTPASGNVQSRSMSVGRDFAVTGSGITIDQSQIQAGRSVVTSQATTGATPVSDRTEDVLNALASLRQIIQSHPDLNPVQKETAEIPLNRAEEELQKLEPNRSLVDQAIATLQKGLEGVESLAKPTAKVAELVAKAWIGL